MKSLKIYNFQIVSCILFLFTCGCSFTKVKVHNSPEHSFGAIADCQYCAKKGNGVRKYSLSKNKLSNCVEEMNKMDLEYVVHLGDFIDRDFESFDVVNPIFNTLTMPKYHVLGNHDFSVKDELKKDVPNKMGLSEKYYSFIVKGWRYIVLDGNDVSFHAYPKNSEQWKQVKLYQSEKNIKKPHFSAIGDKQLSWLKKQLLKAQHNSEKVILYCHFPVYPPHNLNLWNAKEVINTIELFPCVKAYINGHNHRGNYKIKNGVHYLTLKGMVDTNKSSYAVIKVNNDSISVTGYGREENRELLIEKRLTKP
jgi:manganese-dependent ADP-ribose/CDP-alcohol diphosphatase